MENGMENGMVREEIVDDDGVEQVDDEDEAQILIDRLSDILTRTAIELKGPQDGVWHSWHDLPEKVKELKDERDTEHAKYEAVQVAGLDIIRDILEKVSEALAINYEGIQNAGLYRLIGLAITGKEWEWPME